jgi:uncharacterized protein YdaU (DUF1376 family)
MPFYVADWLGDTEHLTASESGGYINLISHYWKHGGLPFTEAEIARLSRMSEREWKHSRDRLAAFFQPGWKHKRIEVELAKCEALSEARKEAVSKRKYRPLPGNVVPIK